MAINILIIVVLLSFHNSQNISKAIEYLEANIYPSSHNECGIFVGNALNAGGFNIRKDKRYAYLFYYDNLLVNAGFTIIGNETKPPNEYLPGDIMVNLNTSEHVYGHVCMYNGSKWLSDFAQNSIRTYTSPNPYPTYFFRYTTNDGENQAETKSCQCYKNFLEDLDSTDEYCEEKIFSFLIKEICPLFPENGVTEEDIDKCELNYFCGTSAESNQSKYLFVSLILISTFILFWI